MMNFSRFNFKIFVIEALFFASAFAIGILSVLKLKGILIFQKEIANILPTATRNLSSDLIILENLKAMSIITIEQFLAAFLFVTVFFLFLIKTKYGEKIIKAFFIVAIFAGAEIIFSMWIGDSAAIILAIILVLGRFVFPRIIIHNIAIIIAIVGVALNFGLGADPFDVMLLLVAISVYDFLAVYATGHMVKMLKATISTGTVFAMIIPDKFSGLIQEVSFNPSLQKNETNFIYLGGGDLAFPLILGVSAAMRYGTGSAIFILAGATLGLLVLNMIFSVQKEKKPMPAMPVLATFSILGFLASFIAF